MCVLTAGPAAAQDRAVIGQEVFMQKVLVIRSVGRAGRSPIHTDSLEAQIVSGRWHAPTAGETMSSADETVRTWENATAQKDGDLSAASRAGYVYWPVVSHAQKVMILEAAGHNLVYVNGHLRAGDPYSTGYVQIPVLLEPGTNDFLFQCSRGRLKAKLTTPTGPLLIAPGDRTLPDLVIGENEPVWSALVLLNATTNFAQVSLRALTRGSPEKLQDIPPLGVCKAGFLLHPPKLPEAGDCSFRVEATMRSGTQKDRVESQVSLRVRRPEQTCKRTFVSSIDDSVQYYAVNPASGPSAQALFLSLHGASVEAIGQADAYSPKRWGPIVCPTNRRPYGFDWEEWGQWDALEVLALARARYHPDPSRIYLTGHSMGGHGTWQLGALFPDRFAAIGPSAGWISFGTYASNNSLQATNDAGQMLRRAAAASDTLLMATNFLQEGVYILHGSDDDNVPVTEARHMVKVLSGFHHEFVYHEQPKVGHWWDASDEPGADCVDWAPLFDFFAHHVIPADAEVRHLQFVTVNPAVSARSHWVTILAQEHSLEPSSVDLQCDPGKRRIVGATANIARLQLALPLLKPGLPFSLELDGQKIQDVSWPAASAGADASLIVSRQENRWQLLSTIPPSDKNPLRSGPFREAFRNHMVFVYGTQGTAAENAWALEKARYDSEAFWYRGNATVKLMFDRAYLEEFAQAGKRSRNGTPEVNNVILYGNADDNAAWSVLLSSSPVQVHRNEVSVGSHNLSGDNLACLFLQPNPRDNRALIGVVSGSGLAGLRLTERMPYFLSGAGFPDCLVANTDLLTKGVAGICAAGFFGLDWQVSSGEFAWQNVTP